MPVQPSQKKRFLLYAGIGFVAIGVVSIAAIYMLVYQPLASQGISGNGFQLEEVHSPNRLAMHDHARLVGVGDGGQQVQVPANIGISSELWNDHSLDEFGIGMAPMHTHDATGNIPIESTVEREFTFGQFLRIWGMDESKIVRLTDTEGSQIPDYSSHILKNGDTLVLEVTE